MGRYRCGDLNLRPLQQRLEAWLRAHPGYTPRRLSSEAKVSENAVGRILAGTRPSMETCRRLARYLGWPLNEMLVLAGYEPIGEDQSACAVSAETEIERSLHRLGLDPDSVALVLALVKRLQTQAQPQPSSG